MMEPKSIRLNAWTGVGSVRSAMGQVPNAAGWALRREVEAAPRLLAPIRPDLRDWRHREVGWGAVLAESAKIPGALARLIAHRHGSVFRYLPNSNHAYSHLRNHAEGKDIAITGAPRGMSPDALPQYLLIYGSPQDVPWQLQYILNVNRCVGRLYLPDTALECYVDLLIKGWPSEDSASSNRSVIWSVVDPQDDQDITHLMRNAIADPVVKLLQDDDQIGDAARFLDGARSPVGVSEFVKTLADHQPGLIVTTSHGKIGPLNQQAEMARELGLPVDHAGEVIAANRLLAEWQPSGAIWYAHACCSAGGDGSGFFTDLFSEGSEAADLLRAVAGLGPTIAPLPTALLSAERPLRAFIGHVEPTFDWTLEQRATKQYLTTGIIDALYTRLFVAAGNREPPVAYAFREWYAQTGGLRAEYVQAHALFNRGADTDEILLTTHLAARDIESTVILGDPTVALPGLV